MQIKDLKQDKRNYRKHNQRNLDLIKKSVTEVGLGRSVVIDNENEIVCGNGLVSTLDKNTPIKVIETDGSELVVVKRTDLATDDAKRKQLAVMDNSSSDSSEFDFELLETDFDIETIKDFGVDVKETNKEIEKPDVEFTEELLEEHNYIVLYFDNSVDWLQAETLFGIEKVKDTNTSEKLNNIGVGRVLNGAKALNKIGVKL